MATLLLVIIYLAFISLGLPDSILGSAWPIMHLDFGVPLSNAGIITMIISGGTILSSFFSEKIIRRFGTGKVTLVSVFMTAMGLLGNYFAPGFMWLCILGVPLGIGAGAVDSALNNFIAIHYEAKHMNWLHCFWGIGATAGPIIMSLFIAEKNGWRMGYATIGTIQMVLVVCLLLSLSIWKKFEKHEEVHTMENTSVTLSKIIRLPGAKPALLGFFCYCAVELTTGLWGSSFLVICKGVSAEKAAKFISLYYLGITIGRFISGFIAMKLNNRHMIRLGQIICLYGVILLMMPLSSVGQMTGLILIGLGCAPIYPAMLHDTPNRFGKEMSQGIMGIQMATAYVGSTFIPPLFGLLTKFIGFKWLTAFLAFFILVMLIASEMVNRVVMKQNL